MAARLQNAIVTSSAVSERERIASAREVASWEEVSESSCEVRMLQVCGIERTSRTSWDGGDFNSHAEGIRDWSSARLRWAIAFQGASGAIVEAYLCTMI